MKNFIMSAIIFGIASGVYGQVQKMSYTNDLNNTYSTEIGLYLLDSQFINKDSFFVADYDIDSNNMIPIQLEKKLLRQGLMSVILDSNDLTVLSDSLSQFNFTLAGRLSRVLFRGGHTYILFGEDALEENRCKFVLALNYLGGNLTSAIILALKVSDFREMQTCSTIKESPNGDKYLKLNSTLSFHGGVSDVLKTTSFLKVNCSGNVEEVE